MEMPFNVGAFLKTKFYLVSITSVLRFGFGLRFEKLTWKQLAFLAVILSQASDRKHLKRYLGTEEARSNLGHLARHVFLLNQSSKCTLDVVGNDLQIRVNKGGIDYRFKILAVPGKSKALFVHDLTPLSEIFFLGVYDHYNYQNGTVVDIGGYIGDTAVYFAKNGASQVYVYEPNPVNFGYLTANVELNGVSNKVRAFNCAVSMERRRLVVPYWGGAGSVFAKREKLSWYDVDNVKPTEILVDKGRISLLKVDCKGCELELFRLAIGQVAEKANYVIIDTERLDSGERQQIIGTLENAGFFLDPSPVDLLYLKNLNPVRGSG